MKQVIRLWQLAALLACVSFSCFEAKAQTTSATPAQFVSPVTSSTRDSFAGDISGSGRFVVIESTGNLSTQRSVASDSTVRNNVDGNREIFLYDYAQRRIFQITDTRSALKPVATPSPTPTPSPSPSPGASPTPTPSPTPVPPPDPATIAVEVTNNHTAISNDGKWIIFSSNAEFNTDPSGAGVFNGNTAANSALLAADGNQEIWLYRIPDVPNVNLSDGGDLTLQDLSGGTFIRITNTAASAVPQPGSVVNNSVISPFVAFDNREPSINNDGTVISFVSNRNLLGGTNNDDVSPEVFVVNRDGGTDVTVQVTNTTPEVKPFIKTFVENPNLSGDGAVLAFISNANIPETGGTGNNADLNGEIFVVRMNGTAVSSLRQVTRTAPASNLSVNLWTPGRHLSRNGNFLAFESLANLSGDNAIQTTPTVFLYDVSTNSSAATSFKQVGPRATSGRDVSRFPTFTGDSSFLVFSSLLNFKADGTAPATAAEGLNPDSRDQLFATPVPAANTFTRLTNTPAAIGMFGFIQMQPYASDSLTRIAFTTPSLDVGAGDVDGSTETYYLRVPTQTAEVASSANAILFFTGASARPVASSSPTPPAVAGLAPGMLGIARPAPTPGVSLAPSAKEGCPRNTSCASEFSRIPALPTELNGVSVSINGAVAGLYFVSPGQINFVVPNGLAASTTAYPVVIYNGNGTVIRTTLIVQAAQPDIFVDDQVPGNRAVVINAVTGTKEPFTVTTVPIGGGAAEPTQLNIELTGAFNVPRSAVSVKIGTTDITGDNITMAPADLTVSDRVAGIQQINVRLPASLAGAGDVPIIVTVTGGGTAFTSRPADSAPRIRIN